MRIRWRMFFCENETETFQMHSSLSKVSTDGGVWLSVDLGWLMFKFGAIEIEREGESNSRQATCSEESSRTTPHRLETSCPSVRTVLLHLQTFYNLWCWSKSKSGKIGADEAVLLVCSFRENRNTEKPFIGIIKKS